MKYTRDTDTFSVKFMKKYKKFFEIISNEISKNHST